VCGIDFSPPVDAVQTVNYRSTTMVTLLFFKNTTLRLPPTSLRSEEQTRQITELLEKGLQRENCRHYGDLLCYLSRSRTIAGGCVSITGHSIGKRKRIPTPFLRLTTVSTNSVEIGFRRLRRFEPNSPEARLQLIVLPSLPPPMRRH
jgi:hypothetical protein